MGFPGAESSIGAEAMTEKAPQQLTLAVRLAHDGRSYSSSTLAPALRRKKHKLNALKQTA